MVIRVAVLAGCLLRVAGLVVPKRLHLGINLGHDRSAVSEAVFLELQRIDSVQPLLRELLAQDGSEAWVGDLQSKGIILLVKTPPEELDGAGPMTIAKSGAPVGSSKSIEELASKTTPTCLSSYLN